MDLVSAGTVIATLANEEMFASTLDIFK